MGSIVLSIIVGALIGWIASIAMRTDTQAEILFDMAMGLIGGVVGPLILFANSLLDSVLAAALGAMIFMAMMFMVRRIEA